MSKIAAACILLMAGCVFAVWAIESRTKPAKPPQFAKVVPAPLPSVPADVVQRLSVAELKPGMVRDGAMVLETSNLLADWKRWKGQRIILRGDAYNADDKVVSFMSDTGVWNLQKIDAETRRFFMRECHEGVTKEVCLDLTIMAVPGEGQYGRELAFVKIMR